jgi:succinate dehydrogenase hydrophobic anchor subunit
MQSTRPRRLPTVLPASGTPVYLGMWTWLWQRASSLVLMVLLPWHWLNPFYRPVRLAVLFFVVFHAMAGIRVMLTDCGVGERWQRGLVWTLAGVGLVVFLFFLQYA